jgi:hypothetical protein
MQSLSFLPGVSGVIPALRSHGLATVSVTGSRIKAGDLAPKKELFDQFYRLVVLYKMGFQPGETPPIRQENRVLR